MRASAILFFRLILRPLRQEPLRTALTVLAVALGVGVVIAIDLAGQAAAGSFHSSLESLTGKGDLLIRTTGGLDQALLGRLEQLPFALQFSPRIEDFAFLNTKGEAIPFIGLDLIANGVEQGETQGTGNAVETLETGDPIWVGQVLGLHTGEHVRLLINDREHQFRVAGVLQPKTGELRDEPWILADIGLAQRVTGKTGKLDSIDVRIPPRGSAAGWIDVLRNNLPASATVEAQGTRTEENRRMLTAFRWNLQVLSYIALIVGGFLIYNTISISVVRRRSEIGIVRALGADRNFVMNGFLAEALFFGIAGSVVGLFLGRLMAVGAVQLIGNTVESLYVSSQPAPVTLTFGPMVVGMLLGTVVALVAALFPAREAARAAPTEAMARGRAEYMASRQLPHAIVASFVMLATAAVFSRLPPVDRRPLFGYAAVAVMIAGTALAIPKLVDLFSRVVGARASRAFGVEVMLAMRSLRASLGRTSVLTAALTTAVAMTISVAVMVGSFRETVSVWMDNQLKADFYLRPAGASSADRHPTISPDVADEVERLPGVAAVDRFRAYPISFQGTPATLAGGETSRISRSEATRFVPGEDRNAILSKLPTGDYAVVSEPFADKHNVHVGSVLKLPLAGAVRQFQVLGIYYDYSTERGFIVLDRRTLLKYLPDPASSNLAVYLVKGADEGQIRREINGAIRGRAVMVLSNRRLRRGAIEIFDRTFRITYALEAVAILVAVMGIAGALLAVVIDRRREFAILRFLGAAHAQVQKIIVYEAALIGLLANLIGVALGTLLSLILIFVINKQSFGWTIQFHWPAAVVLRALAGVYAATVLSAFYPARIAKRMNPIEAVHEE